MPLNVLISFALALIMFAVGMSIDFRAFKAITLRPTAFFVGLSSQMLVLPFMAFLIVWMAPLDPYFKIGLFIVALCPGGTTSNYISYLIKGNTALSISLTTINGLLSLLTIPFLTNIALQYFTHTDRAFYLPFLDTVWQILLVTLIPALLGAGIKSKFPQFSIKYHSVIKRVTILILALVFGILLLGNKSQGGVQLTFNEVGQILPFALLLHLLGLLWGFYLPRISGFSVRNSITLSIEVGLQNTTLALLITETFLHEPAMTKPAIVYAAFSFWTTLGFAWWQKRREDLF